MAEWYDRHFNSEYSQDKKALKDSKAFAAPWQATVAELHQLMGQAQVLNGKDLPMSSPLGVSQPSPPAVAPIESAGVRYEQDIDRQRRADAQRGGWLVAIDAGTGARLWAVQVYANPYDDKAPVRRPARWFTRMTFAPDARHIEIEDIVGARFEVDLQARTVTQVGGPPPASPPKPDNRPSFD